ncbi:hypothetical protein ACFYU8_18575 [Brevibacillus sp. NPDC003359]|uniref:hypothetical protein n=1 Tax=unclassified Brevibacillus TaxID=2684853 RepID=UPI0036CE2DD3
MNVPEALPFNAAICIKRDKHRSYFLGMYGEDYCSIQIEEDDPHIFMDKIRRSTEPIHFVYLGECAYHRLGSREEYTEALRECVELIQEKFDYPLIHLHILKENLSAYDDLLQLGNVYNTLFSEKRIPSSTLIEERIINHFKCRIDELKEIRRIKKKSSKSIQMNLNDYQKTNEGEVVIADTGGTETSLPIDFVFEHMSLPIQENEGGALSKIVDAEHEQHPTSVETVLDEPVPERVQGGRKKKQTKKKTEEADGTPTITQEIEVADDISFGLKEQAKALVQSALMTQGRYFKIKQSLRSGIQEKSIAVVNLLPRSGSSFVVNNFAIALGQSQVAVGVLEAQQPTPQLFLRLGGLNGAPSNWESWYENVKRNKMTHRYGEEDYSVSFIQSNLEWYKHQVYWIPYWAYTHMQNPKGMGFLDSLAIYYTADKLPVLLIDLSYDFDAGFQRLLLEEVDEVWVVVEPDANLLRYQEKRIKQLLGFVHTKNVYYIVNKKFEFSDLAATLTFLEQLDHRMNPEPLTSIPYSVEFARAEAENSFAYLYDEGKNILYTAFAPLFKRVISDSYYEDFIEVNKPREQRKKGIFR